MFVTCIRSFRGRVVSALEHEAGDPGSIPGSDGYCYHQYRPRLDNRGGTDTHRGLCWKLVVPSIPGGDFRILPTLNK